MRETVMLKLIAALQGALMLLGYVIELDIQGMYAQKVAAWHRSIQQHGVSHARTFTASCRLFSCYFAHTSATPLSGVF